MAQEKGKYLSTDGEFTRDQRYISTRITADGRDGFAVEPGRFRLVVSRACPWASRAIIVRRLLGLENVLSMGAAGPTHDQRSWTFDLDPGGRDPVLGIERLQEAYFARFPGYERGITVPAIVDVTTGQVVTNDYAQITLDLETEWRRWHRQGAPDLYPVALRDQIDAMNDQVYTDVNDAVYQCGFAGSQEAYDQAFQRLFARLDKLSDHLATRRYLVGQTITEADIRLFTLWCASTRSTTGTSNAIGTSSPSCRCSGPTPGICSRLRVLVTQSTSARSNSTIIWYTGTSTLPA